MGLVALGLIVVGVVSIFFIPPLWSLLMISGGVALLTMGQR